MPMLHEDQPTPTAEKLPAGWITVTTTLPTLPFAPLDSRPVIRSERLIIRQFKSGDIHAVHAVRSQPEVMEWTLRGVVDADLQETQSFLDKKLGPDADTNYSCVICLASTGEVIGTGGCHTMKGQLGWPDLGYMLRKEYWGQGYGTEFVRTFLQEWWLLPRTSRTLAVDSSTIAESDLREGIAVKECLMAIAAHDNVGSLCVLRKAGMELVKTWVMKDPRQRSGGAEVRVCGHASRSPHGIN